MYLGISKDKKLYFNSKFLNPPPLWFKWIFISKFDIRSIIHTYRRTIILFFFFLKIKVESEIEFRELKFVGTFLTTWKFRKYNDTRLGGYKYRPNISRASSLPPLRSDCVFLKSRLRNASECKYLIKDYVSFGKCVEVVVYLRSKNTALRCIVIY